MTEPWGRPKEACLHEDCIKPTNASTTTDCYPCERKASIQLSACVAWYTVVLELDAKTSTRHSTKCLLKVQDNGIELTALQEDEGPVMNS